MKNALALLFVLAVITSAIGASKGDWVLSGTCAIAAVLSMISLWRQP